MKWGLTKIDRWYCNGCLWGSLWMRFERIYGLVESRNHISVAPRFGFPPDFNSI
jgi:hypothetical protein